MSASLVYLLLRQIARPAVDVDVCAQAVVQPEPAADAAGGQCETVPGVSVRHDQRFVVEDQRQPVQPARPGVLLGDGCSRGA
jgi:hypothetical protein